MKRERFRSWLARLMVAAIVLYIALNFSIIRTKLQSKQDFTDMASFATCLNRKTEPLFTWPYWPNPRKGWRKDRVSVVAMKGGEVARIWNYLGWHVTWMAVIDLRDASPIAYETYDKNSGMRIVFYGAIPASIQAAIPACGVTFGGAAPDDVGQAFSDEPEEEKWINIKR